MAPTARLPRVPEVRLHRCILTFVHHDIDACWKVQKALDDQGIDYEVVKGPTHPRGRRKEVIEISGQDMLPMIEFENGSAYRAESNEMAAEINAGRLFDHVGEARRE
jgi:glutaredoxin